MAKLSGVAVLLLIVVPLSMYTCVLLVGVQLGRALERNPGSLGVRPVQTLVDRIPDSLFGGGVEFTWRGTLETLDYVKELWEINVLGRRRGGRQDYLWVPLEMKPLSDPVVNNSDDFALEIIESSANETSSTQRRHYYSNYTSPRGVISVGPWGGSGGQPFYMSDASAPRLRSIILYHSGAIHSLSCEYTLAGDHEGRPLRVDGPWGLSYSYGSRGVRTEIQLHSWEHITAVEGTTGHFANVPSVVITSLTFRTSAGRTYGPYGSVAAGAHYFSAPAADGACIAGFWGRSGWLVDAIGVYMKPSCSSSSSDTAAYKKYTYRRQGRN